MANLIHVATIIGAHGIKGEVKVKSCTSDPYAFASYGPLQAHDGRVFEVQKLRMQTNNFICMLSNVIDRNSAESLRGTELFVVREKLSSLKPGEIYLSDLQGKEAVANAKNLGRIIGFQNFGAGELVELENGLLIPMTFFVKVEEEVYFELPDGYLELV